MKNVHQINKYKGPLFTSLQTSLKYDIIGTSGFPCLPSHCLLWCVVVLGEMKTVCSYGDVPEPGNHLWRSPWSSHFTEADALRGSLCHSIHL